MVVQSLTNWKLAGFWPYTPIQSGSMETGHIHQGVTGVIDATVPGSIYADLLRAGLIQDPYYEMNSLSCEWVKDRWWVYNSRFIIPDEYKGKKLRIVFKGIDYKARVYFNNQHMADHEGMYEPLVLDITDLAWFEGKENQLKVILESAPDEMGQIGYTSRTFTQKARFNYKWDFCTRLVGMGIWNDVLLECSGDVRILDTAYKYTQKKLTYKTNIEGEGRVEISLSYQGKPVSQGTGEGRDGVVTVGLPVEHPELWYPNGYGKQPLYDLTVKVFDKNGNLSDEKVQRVGLRTLKYERPAGATPETIPYTPVVNGKRIYIKGVNMTPLDMMYGCVDRSRYEPMLRLAKEANVTLIREWGGGLIEKEAFYDLCDELGLMVWQEFIQSSSGIDNIPSERPEFLALLEKTARAALVEKRNHVSLTFWSGGNELFEASGIPAQYSNKNIAMLRKICKELDPERLMLPTSASGPIGWRDDKRPKTDHHDIHGPWKYAGARGENNHYKLYNTSPIELHSEFGVDGMTNMSSIRTFLSPKNRVVTTVAENVVWRHHGEWWDTSGYRDFPIFGKIDDLETYVKISQFMQGEGIRYALEANRRRKWQNVGSIVWQFNEPWPNISCTCLVDYYANPKFAYYTYRDAMKPWHVSMRYEQLLFRPGEVFQGTVVPLDDLRLGFDKLGVQILDSDNNVLFETELKDFLPFEWKIPEEIRTFRVRCTMQRGKKKDQTDYLFFVISDEHPYASVEEAVRYVDTYPY